MLEVNSVGFRVISGSVSRHLEAVGKEAQTNAKAGVQLHDLLRAIPDVREVQADGTAFCSTVSTINHDCRPNAQLITHLGDTTVEIVVRALRVIPPGEEVTIAYINVEQSVEKRAESLRNKYAFTCECRRCSSEIGTGRGRGLKRRR